jgi:hypothetical protein
MRARSWWGAGLFAVALGSGCEAIFHFDKVPEGTTSGTGGHAGAGGGASGRTVVSGGSGGVSGSSGGAVTTSTSAECQSDGNCADPPDPCHKAICTTGKCIVLAVPDGEICGQPQDACHKEPVTEKAT